MPGQGHIGSARRGRERYLLALPSGSRAGGPWRTDRQRKSFPGGGGEPSVQRGGDTSGAVRLEYRVHMGVGLS